MLRPSSAGYTKDDLCGERPRAAQKKADPKAGLHVL